MSLTASLRSSTLTLFALALGSALGPPAPAQEGPASARGIAEGSELVLRGRVLDQAAAPFGLWHRFQVEEVLWPRIPADAVGATGPSGALRPVPAAGETVRIYAHGPGVPEGAALSPGGEVILAASWLPAAGADPSSANRFFEQLREDFQPDRPGEEPAIAAADGILPAGPGGVDLEAVRRLVSAVRGAAAGDAASGAVLLELAGHPEAAVRELAVRGLSGAAAAGEPIPELLLERFREEIDGPAHPGVLSAHLDLSEALEARIAGPLLERLILRGPREGLALAAGAALARRGRKDEFLDLARAYPAAPRELKLRIVRVLGEQGNVDPLPVFTEALSEADPEVRDAAAGALAADGSPGALAALESARRDPSPSVRAAAGAALLRRSAAGGPGSIAGREAAPAARLSAALEAARRRLASEPPAGPGGEAK